MRSSLRLLPDLAFARPLATALHAMRTSTLLVAFGIGVLAAQVWSSEVIVCFPLAISFNESVGELTISPKVEEALPGNHSGVICNSHRSWCRKVRLVANVPTKIEVPRDNVSRTIMYFQTEDDASRNYGACEWPVNM